MIRYDQLYGMWTIRRFDERLSPWQYRDLLATAYRTASGKWMIKLAVEFVFDSSKMLQEEEEKDEADYDDGVPDGECFAVEARLVRQVPTVHG
jgi:hypothetical protein